MQTSQEALSDSSQESDDQRARQTIIRWRKGGPALFAQEALGATPTAQQLEGSKALVEKRRVSIRSGHGTGKSTFMAWTILWFSCCYYPCKIPCTAPSAHQLDDVLWAELGMWHGKLKARMPELGAEFEWSKERFVLKSNPSESFSVARTSRPEKPEALQGFHAENIMFLIDEASGVPDEVFQVAEGALSTEGAFVLMAANPTRMDGYFYDSHHKMRERWAALHWNGEDSPLVAKAYVEDMAFKYGVESAIYRIRVRGDFAGNPDGVIPLDTIEAAIGRQVTQFGAMRWGLDVARFGADRTALCKRHGNWITEPIKTWTGKDTMQVAGIVKAEYDAARLKPEAIMVDVIGLGAGVVDRLKEMGVPVVGVNVAESPSVQDRYNRLRDELWFRGREWFAARECQIMQDDTLIAELTLPSYKLLSNGKIQVESKEDLKKRGVVSPDVADSFLLTFANGGVSRWSKAIKVNTEWIV